MGTTGVTLGRTIPEVVGIPGLITWVIGILPPAVMGTRAGGGNTIGSGAMEGPGMRGQFTMAALKTPEPEALSRAFSPPVGVGVAVVVICVLSTMVVGVVMTDGTVVIGGAVVTGGVVVVTTRGNAITTGMVTTGAAIEITTLTGSSYTSTVAGGNKSSGRGNLTSKVLRAASWQCLSIATVYIWNL